MNEWKDILEASCQHYTRLLGVPTSMCEEAMLKILEAQMASIFLEARAALEKITLAELHKGAKQLAKNKVPSKDKICVKSYLALWDQVGPNFLEVLLDGLRNGSLHPKLTHGIIILVAKKGTNYCWITSMDSHSLVVCVKS